MSKKRNRLRDSITVRTSSFVKQPNGDIAEIVDALETYRCAIYSREQGLIDRSYETPQAEYDYRVELRAKTFGSSGIEEATRLTTSKTGNVVFQVVGIKDDTLRKTVLSLKATGQVASVIVSDGDGSPVGDIENGGREVYTLNGQLTQTIVHGLNGTVSTVFLDLNGIEFDAEVQELDEERIKILSTVPLLGTVTLIA